MPAFSLKSVNTKFKKLSRFQRRFILISSLTVWFVALIILTLFYPFTNLQNKLFLKPFESKNTDPIVINTLAKTMVNNCLNKNLQCFANKFADLTKTKDIETVLAVFSEIQKQAPQTRDCHVIAHYIAQSETTKQPDQWLTLINKFDSNICGGGFIHGVLETHSQLDSNFKLTPETINDICIYIGDKTQDNIACSHSLGHILLAQEGANIQNSINICNQTAYRFRYPCTLGVFMENLTRENLIHQGVAEWDSWDEETRDNQEKICRQYQGSNAQACWREMAHLYVSLSEEIPDKAYEMCKGAPEAAFQKTCQDHAIGIVVTSEKLTQDNISSICQPFVQDQDRFQKCINLAISGALSSSIAYKDRLTWFCDSLSGDDKNYCHQKVSEGVGQRSNTSVQKPNNCQALWGDKKARCLNQSSPD